MTLLEETRIRLEKAKDDLEPAKRMADPEVNEHDAASWGSLLINIQEEIDYYERVLEYITETDAIGSDEEPE